MMLVTKTVKSVPTLDDGQQLSSTSVTNINLAPCSPILMLVTYVETRVGNVSWEMFLT